MVRSGFSKARVSRRGQAVFGRARYGLVGWGWGFMVRSGAVE